MATEVLAEKFDEQVAVNFDDKSISEETIDEVNGAIVKFREQSARLGVDERELMEIVRDCDRSVYSASLKSFGDQGTSGLGGAADRFMGMLDYYF